jgi:hypothetical protein
VRNVVSGLACGRPNVDQRVCFATSHIEVTGEGHCNYDGRDVPCTWIGVSFTYDAAGPADTLSCGWTSSYPLKEGNAEGVRSPSTSGGRVRIALPTSSHFHFEPFFALLPADPRAIGRVIAVRYSCSSSGHHLFSFAYDLHYPER